MANEITKDVLEEFHWNRYENCSSSSLIIARNLVRKDTESCDISHPSLSDQLQQDWLGRAGGRALNIKSARLAASLSDQINRFRRYT